MKPLSRARVRRLHTPRHVRPLACAIVLAVAIPATAGAADPPILAIEPRVGRGVSLGGGAGEASARLSPLTFGVLVEYAFRSDPWVSCYGGPYAELLDRGSIGAIAGLRFRPASGWARIGLGGVAIFAPYTLAGPTVSFGGSFAVGGVPLSVDIEGAAFVVGNDLPAGTVAGQIQVVVGVPLEVF